MKGATRGHRSTAAFVVVGAMILAACGGGQERDASTTLSAKTAASAPAAAADRFPFAAPGEDMEQVLASARAGGPQLAPSVSNLTVGEGRFGFGLFDGEGRMVRADEVALYLADRNGRKPSGPFPARRESLEIAPPFRSKQTAAEATPFVYVASVRFPRRGRFAVVPVVRRNGELLAGDPVPVVVRAKDAVPAVGEQAPRITTLTAADVGGDLGKLTTRQPPLESLVDTNFADVVGRKPVVLVFATPQLCQTRVCGPVVDVAAELQARYGDRVAFIQQEIYVDNDVSKGLRPQLEEFGLRSEPWTFVIDRSGVIAARFEGALSVQELEAAVRGVAG